MKGIMLIKELVASSAKDLMHSEDFIMHYTTKIVRCAERNSSSIRTCRITRIIQSVK